MREGETHNEVSRRLGPMQASRAEAIKQLKHDNLMPGAKKLLLWMDAASDMAINLQRGRERMTESEKQKR